MVYSHLPLLFLAQALYTVADDCLSDDVLYVTANEPPCCTASMSPLLSTLANRTAHASSSDGLLSALVFPGSEHFGSSSVSTRPRFERPQKIFGKMYVRRLYAVSQKSQQYTLVFDMYWRWRDCRLIFDGNVLDVNARSSFFEGIWVPEVAFKEEAHSTEKRNLDSNLQLFGDGLVMMKQQFSRQLACSFNFKDLPFDTQTCTITASMPEFTSETVELHWDPDPFVMDTLTNGEWSISGYDEWKNSLERTSYAVHDPGPERSISALAMSFSMARRSHGLIVEYIIPSAVYWLCSYSGLWVDASAVPGHVALGLIPILTLNNKMGQLRGILPPVNESFRLESFILSAFLLSIIQLLEFCLVNSATRIAKAAKQQKEENCRVVPEFLPPNRDAEHNRGRTCLSSGTLLSCATWAQHNLDRHSRWFFLILFICLSFGTLLS